MKPCAVLIALAIARAAAADSSVAAAPGAIARVYLAAPAGACGAVHVVRADGHDVTLAPRDAFDPKLAPDGRTVGWLHCVRHDHGAPGWMTDALVLARGRRATRRVALDPFGRGWGFRDGGRAVAVYFGSHHGPGVYELVAVASGRVLAQTTDGEIYAEGRLIASRPEWLQDLAEK